MEDDDINEGGDDRQFLAGTMLIAMPNMQDERFQRSVLLICAHDEHHAMGIVVNKPLDDVSFAALLEQLDVETAGDADERDVMFGGPVQTDRGFVLHTLDYRTSSTLQVTPELGLSATKEILGHMAASRDNGAPERALLALGYAGWGEGQLEAEIAQNAWAHCPAAPDLIFSDSHDDKWRRALARLGVTEAMLSTEWAAARRDDAPLH